MDECFQKNSFLGEDQSQWDEAASMLEDLKQLDAALDGVMVSSVSGNLSTCSSWENS